MALVVSDIGEVKMLNLIFGKSSSENLICKLYTNDYTPIESSVVSSFTEASTYGYASVTVTPSDWTVATGNPAGDPAYGTTAELMFPFTGAAGNMYGYFVVGETSGDLYWAERFGNGPINIQNVNDRVIVPLKFGLE